MSPWELAIGQIVGYKPLGPKWRGRITAVERDGKCHYAVIPVVDAAGVAIVYEHPPKDVQLVLDYGNFYLVEQAVQMTDPWLAARLDHEDLKPPRKKEGE